MRQKMMEQLKKELMSGNGMMNAKNKAVDGENEESGSGSGSDSDSSSSDSD